MSENWEPDDFNSAMNNLIAVINGPSWDSKTKEELNRDLNKALDYVMMYACARCKK